MTIPTLCEVDGVDRTEEFRYLDDLGEDSLNNMWGCDEHIEDRFGHNAETAGRIVSKWLETAT